MLLKERFSTNVMRVDWVFPNLLTRSIETKSTSSNQTQRAKELKNTTSMQTIACDQGHFDKIAGQSEWTQEY